MNEGTGLADHEIDGKILIYYSFFNKNINSRRLNINTKNDYKLIIPYLDYLIRMILKRMDPEKFNNILKKITPNNFNNILKRMTGKNFTNVYKLINQIIKINVLDKTISLNPYLSFLNLYPKENENFIYNQEKKHLYCKNNTKYLLKIISPSSFKSIMIQFAISL